MPDALSLSRSELPEEIEKAIRFLTETCLFANRFNDAALINRSVRNGVDALTAAILSRLSAAETGQWQPIETAPTDRPIVVRMPSKSLPGGWFVVTAQLPDPDDDSRFGSCSTIYHYNGAVLMGGFRGMWTHWREDATPASKDA